MCSVSLGRRQWHPTPVLLPGKSHGQRSLVGCSPWGHQESDTTEWLHFHFSLSCTGEGNGNPLQCSWLENPRDGGAWWAAVYGVVQSRTRLKWLSSSSSVSLILYSDRVFASFCPCHGYSLEVFTRDKNWLFTLFPLLLAFFEINQGAVCKFLNWSPPISCLRKCKVKACCSVAQSCPTLQPYGLQHTRLPCPSLSPGACSL